MKRNIITVLAILVCFLLQGTLFRRLSFASVGPNLMLIVTVSFSFMRGQKTGMAVGFVSGFLMDLFWGTSLGFYMVVLTVLGYLNGAFERLFYDDDRTLPLFLIGASELAFGLASCLAYQLLEGNFSLWYCLGTIILPEFVYTLLVALVLYQILRVINRKLEEEEQRSASRFA